MRNEYVLTKADALKEIEIYKKVFGTVRILRREDIASICSDGDVKTASCPCYSFWKRTVPCENCVSARALENKKDEVKLEFTNDGVYQVIAHYVEIDGEPCVIELLREFNSDKFVSISGQAKLLTSIDDYYEKTYSDVLTGAYNRRFYEEELKDTVMSAGVAMIDLDDFKVYNDIYGHMVGDAVLKEFVSELKKNIRTSDKLIRFGGDEFLLIMPGVQSSVFESVLKHILQCVSNIVLPGYTGINVTSSIGATVCLNEPIQFAVNRADKLLYHAKSKKNSIVTDNDGEISTEINKKTVLIVDDAEINRTVLKSILQNEFNVIEADGGQACIDALTKYETRISLVLLDIVMPDVNGFDVLKFMKTHHYIDEIPVITITSDESEQTIRRAYEMGASDFVSRSFDAKVVYRRILYAINFYEKQRRLISTVSSEIIEKEKCNSILIDILSQIAEFRSGLGRDHFSNINRITELLLTELIEKTSKYGITENDVYLISTAAALHDIGKVEIDRKILDKPGKLTAEEFEIIKKHTVLGAEIVMNVHKYHNEPLVKYAYQICMYHHEKYDGKGYPKGLKGDDIPIAAQVVSLADVYDALTAKRVYKDAYSTDEAIKMILNGECGAFNPLLLECLVNVKNQIVKGPNGEIR